MTTEDLLHNAATMQAVGNTAEAERLYRAALDADAGHPQAQRLFAIFLLHNGRAEEAERHMARAVQLAPSEAYMHQNHALALMELGRFEDAAEAASRAIALDAYYAPAYFNRANALAQMGRTQDALVDYEQAEIRGLADPALFFAHALALAAIGRREDALGFYGRAITANPDFLEAIVNRGILLNDMHLSGQALAAFDRALMLNPNVAPIHNMRGVALFALKRYAEAMDSYKTALSLAPDYAKTWHNAALLLRDVRQFEQALAAFERAHALQPDLPWLEGHRLELKLQLCDWTDYDHNVASLIAHVEEGKKVAQPFHLTFIPATQAQTKKAAEIHIAERCPPQTPIFLKARRPGRLRIAYVCKDFFRHATTLLMTDVLEAHDRGEFEIFGISHGLDDGTPERARIVSAFAHFLDVRGLDDRQIAQQMHDLSIDIAIDLDGHTQDSRPAILSHRPAPVQAQFLAYPGTMAAPHIDYIISDTVVTVPEDAPFYSEKFARLPGAYQPNGPRPESANVTRAQAGLPETGFVFGCFNNSFKITPAVFDSWMRILTRVPGSVLWLMDYAPAIVANLRKEATARNVDPARLVFAARADIADHIARHRHMDLFLDTFIYGAHTTASDALWADVPVLTLKGGAFPSRVAASLLSAIGLDELITESPQAYENLAVDIAADPARLARLKQALSANRAPLFDPARFARNLEAAYRTMWAKYEAGEQPQGFDV